MIITPHPSRILCSLAATAALFLGASPSFAVLYDFNDTSDLANGFNQGTISGVTASATNVSSGGLNNSGSLLIPDGGAGADSFYYMTKEGISPTAATAGVSIYFLAQASTGGAALPLTLGLVDASSTSQTANTSALPNGGANSLTLSLRNSGNTVGSGLTYSLSAYNNASMVGSTSTAFTLTEGNWYYLSLETVYNGSGSYTLVGQVYNASSAGVVGAALLSNAASWTTTNTGLAAADEAYGVLSSQFGDRRGLGSNLDNYSVVPEPTSCALLIGALAIAGLARMRTGRARGASRD